jgi:hypothetical protein
MIEHPKIKPAPDNKMPSLIRMIDKKLADTRTEQMLILRNTNRQFLEGNLDKNDENLALVNKIQARLSCLIEIQKDIEQLCQSETL